MSNGLPKISVAIPTRNEEKNIARCLDSIFNQNYPKNKLEVVVIDDGSSDTTIEIAKKYPVVIMSHNSRDGEVGKMIAFNNSSGDYFIYLDADIHLRGNNWFSRMLKPLIEDKAITASFTRDYSDKHSSFIERYLNMDPLQRDPIYQYFSSSLDDVLVNEKAGYKVLSYKVNKIPPAGRCLYRRDVIKPLLENMDRFLELDLLVDLVRGGRNLFAYVPCAGLYHHHAKNMADLVRKRQRNVTKVFLKNNKDRKYRWFDVHSPRGVAKILLWILLVTLILPLTCTGLYKMFKYQKLEALYEPVVGLVVTYSIIMAFLSRPRELLLLMGLKK